MVQQDAKLQTSNTIYNYFRNNGYIASNYQGAGSIKAQILYNISAAETNYDHVAVVDFDHGVGNPLNFSGSLNEFHYMFEDNIGTYANGVWNPSNGVYDYEIYNNSTGDTFFAFINACLSANINNTVGTYNSTQGLVQGVRARGMPFAWTHRLVNWKGFANFSSTNHISLFGYSDADSSSYCYIGFPYGSAALNQTITGISPIYATWVQNFFYYALSF